MTGKLRPGLGTEYLQSLRNYVDAGGRLRSDDAYELLDELERHRNDIIEECALAAALTLRDRELVGDKASEGLLQRACNNIRALKL
jgi:hypothetical protein